MKCNCCHRKDGEIVRESYVIDGSTTCALVLCDDCRDSFFGKKLIREWDARKGRDIRDAGKGPDWDN